MGWLKKMTSGLQKSSARLKEGLKGIFANRKLDEATLEELEDLLVSSDMGFQAASAIAEDIRKRKFPQEEVNHYVKEAVSSQITDMLTPVARPIEEREGLHVIMLYGVNGSGKTTTAGKLAKKYTALGKKVMLVACDTFRAAAVQQLREWGERSDCFVEYGGDKEDPAAVAYKALQKAIGSNYDIVIIDTAGRLHNNQDLMNQLSKIGKVVANIDDSFPHDSIIVLDATTGQNSIAQTDAFKKSIKLTGVIMTKLDGTAKGGIIVELANKHKLPIHAIGVGEGVEDLNHFNPEEFAQSLLG